MKKGDVVLTNTQLGSTKGMLVHHKHIDARGPGKRGVLGYPVPGHGGDVWWVEHRDGSIGVYCYDEFTVTMEQFEIDGAL